MNLKVAVVTREYPPYVYGGCGISVTLLVRQLRKKGIHVDVYVFNENLPASFNVDSNINKFAFFYKSVNERMWPLVNIQTINKLWKKLNRYDIVHAYSTVQMASLGFMRQTTLELPVVATLNGEEAACLYHQKWNRDHCKKCGLSDIIYCARQRVKMLEKVRVPATILSLYFFIQRVFAQSLDKYLALSTAIKNLYSSCGFPVDKIAVVPNMYDPLFLEKLDRLNLNKNCEKTIILYVGRLVMEKGVGDLIKAFSKVKSNKVELWIVGDGPHKKQFEKLTKMTCGDKVKFLGYIKPYDLPAIYKKAHIFVHPAKWPEPFSRSILEAMLAGLAIIASNSGANPEILEDSGVIYGTGNVDELTSKLETLVDNENIRKDFGDKAKIRALEKFSPEVITFQIIEEYKRLCS